MERTCRKCGETKPIEKFVKNENSCKVCRAEYKKEYYIKNKEHVKEYQIKNKDEIKNRKKEYHLKNKEYFKEHRKKYRIKNKEYIKEYNKEYMIKNKEYIKEYGKKIRDDLNESYILARIRSNTGLSIKTAKQHPELIENFRQQILIKRLIKSKKNENIKTS